MHHLFYAAIPPTKTPICFLVQTIRKQEIEDAYITPFGVNPDEVMVLDLYQNQKKKQEKRHLLKLTHTFKASGL